MKLITLIALLVLAGCEASEPEPLPADAPVIDLPADPAEEMNVEPTNEWVE